MSAVHGTDDPSAPRTRPLAAFPPWAVISAAWAGPAILAMVDAFVQSRLDDREPAQPLALLWQGGDWLLRGAFVPVIFRLARGVPLARPHLARRVALHLLCALAMCVLWAGGGTLLRWLLLGAAAVPTARFALSWLFTTFPFGVAVYFAMLAVEHGMFYLKESRDQAARTARLSQQLAEARLDALRMQLDPHFFFNTLNAATVLARDGDARGATRVLEGLGELMHEVLRGDQATEVPLSRELDFSTRYLAIQQIRFQDRLRPVFEVGPGTLDAAVPRFVLQPLIENALRHAVARREDAGLVHVRAAREGDDLVLSVRDDGPGLRAGAPPPAGGLGLANTRERLTTLYGARARFELVNAGAGGALATIRIPFHVVPPPGAR